MLTPTGERSAAMDIANLFALIAVLGTAVVYGTDVFCAMVQRPALAGIDERALLAVMGNVHRYGGGMKVTPRAAPDDGLLDVCFVGRMNKLKLLCWVPTIFFGAHLRLKPVEYFQARQVRIAAARSLDVYADGDYACAAPVDIRIIPKALRVIVPAPISL